MNLSSIPTNGKPIDCKSDCVIHSINVLCKSIYVQLKIYSTIIFAFIFISTWAWFANEHRIYSLTWQLQCNLPCHLWSSLNYEKGSFKLKVLILALQVSGQNSSQDHNYPRFTHFVRSILCLFVIRLFSQTSVYFRC